MVLVVIYGATVKFHTWLLQHICWDNLAKTLQILDYLINSGGEDLISKDWKSWFEIPYWGTILTLISNHFWSSTSWRWDVHSEYLHKDMQCDIDMSQLWVPRLPDGECSVCSSSASSPCKYSTSQASCYSQFEKTYATKQKNVKSHVFWILKKRKKT